LRQYALYKGVHDVNNFDAHKKKKNLLRLKVKKCNLLRFCLRLSISKRERFLIKSLKPTGDLFDLKLQVILFNDFKKKLCLFNVRRFFAIFLKYKLNL